MEDSKNFSKEDKLNSGKLADVSGGAGGYSGGYCPQSPDRCCRVEAVGSWDPENEICQTCSWRAW